MIIKKGIKMNRLSKIKVCLALMLIISIAFIFFRADSIHLTKDIGSVTNLPEKLSKIKENVQYSNINYKGSIEINKAEHLDSNRNFISDIYDSVKARDEIWSETIPSGDYLRVGFEKELISTRDITIYPRIIKGNPRIEVYENGKGQKIADFGEISENKKYKVYLTNLIGEQDTFDLLTTGGNVQFDYIVDPTVPDVIINYPLNNTQITNNNSVLLNWTVQDDGNNNEIFVWASNDSVNLYDYLVYHGIGKVNGTYTYNFSAQPFRSNSDTILLLHFDNLSSYGESQTLVYDFAGSDNNATIQDAVFNETGFFAGAYEFNGIISNRNITVDDADVFDITNISISMWFVKRGDGDTAGWAGIGTNIIPLTSKGLGGGDGGGIDSSWLVGVNLSNAIRYGFETQAGADQNCITSPTIISQDKWYHIVYTRNYTTQSLYINGLYDSSCATNADSAINAINIGIGGGRTLAASTVDGAWNGSIDEFVILNKTLTSAEVNNIYNLSLGLKYWRVNASDGTNMNSSGIYEFNMTVPSVATDNEYPLFSSLSDNNGSLLDNGLGLFNATIASTSGTIYLMINNTNYTTFNSTTAVYNVSINLSSGVYPYFWLGWGNGTSHNFNISAVRYYTVNSTTDTTNPTVTLNSPTNGANLTYTNITFNCSVTDNIGLTNITLYINGSEAGGATESSVVAQVSASTDDAEECIPDGNTMDTTSSDLELADEDTAGTCDL